MNYAIINTSSLERFEARVAQLVAAGHKFTTDFAFRLAEPEKEYPGCWGCLRFAGPLPAEWLFTAPDVEYRYFASNNEWGCNGTPALRQSMLRGLHQYFVGLEGNH